MRELGEKVRKDTTIVLGASGGSGDGRRAVGCCAERVFARVIRISGAAEYKITLTLTNNKIIIKNS